MELVLYPDQRLRQKCKKVTKTDRTRDMFDFAKKMYPFMLEHDGAAIAAPQVGLNKRFFVVKEGILPLKHRIAINPTWWVIEDGKEYLLEEGCLSFPGLLLQVRRFSKIYVQYEDWRGRMYESGLNGFAAQVFQHETDHLNGKLMTDRFAKFILNEKV